MVYPNLASESDQTYAKATHETEDVNLRETDDFEEILAEAVYEGLSLVSCLVAPALDTYIQGATTVEIGVRKNRLNTHDCEALQNGLDTVFGFGAKVVEYNILKILHSKLGVSKKIEQSFEFSNEVKSAKELYKSRPQARSAP
jgi:hypothetical protein